MSMSVTLAAAAVVAALGALCGWLGARPPSPHRGARLVPYRFLMLVCAAVVLMLIVHAVNLAGFATGRR